jgi:hydroxyethylthiazole kinase
MPITTQDICQNLESVRRRSPLVHNITNYVTMNLTANALLAVGASPVMAHAPEEVDNMVDIAAALVVNIGTLSEPWVRSMLQAARRAKKRDIPIIYDPVGAGATPYRTRTIRALIRAVPPTIVRGNASEIIAITEDNSSTKGVDNVAAPQNAMASARRLSEQQACVVCISGVTDYIIDKNKMLALNNGHALMAKVTGLGCAASALCAAFAAVNRDHMAATAAAMAVMGIAGEIAAEKSAGPGSLALHFLDALFNMNDEEIGSRLKIAKIHDRDTDIK